MGQFNSANTGIALFVYNRPDHTAEVLNGLARNPVKKLTVFQDGLKPGHGAEAHAKTRSLIESIRFCEVDFICQEKNRGLAPSILAGVNQVLEKNDAILVLEDDCVPSSKYLEYSFHCLSELHSNPAVFSISGYGLPTFPRNYPYDLCFSPLPSSWGWGTWKDRWKKFDPAAPGWERVLDSPEVKMRFDAPGDLFSDLLRRQMSGQISSWAIRWYYCHFINNAYCVWPIRSRIRNIGMDGSGVHCNPTHAFDVELEEGFDAKAFRIPPVTAFDPAVRRAFLATYDSNSSRKWFDRLKHPGQWPRLFKRAMEKAGIV